MEYTIQKLASLANTTTRTLRYYDEIGLLKPKRYNISGYRIYGTKEVDILQQILLYRNLGMELSDIKQIINAPNFNRLKALQQHLKELKDRKKQIELLIRNVNQTIKNEKGDYMMSDQEKFEGLKKQLVKENEETYGNEVREKYGKDIVEKSNAKMLQLSEQEYNEMQMIEEEIKELLEQGVKEKEVPSGTFGAKIIALHKKWLSFTWTDYKKEAHLGLTQMYVEDERFRSYYDKNVEGCAEFLKQAAEYHL